MTSERLQRIVADIEKKKKALDELRKLQRRELAAERERERKERTRRLIITGANIEKVLGFVPDMGLLLGLVSLNKELFGKADSNEKALEYKLAGDEILKQLEAQNLAAKAKGAQNDITESYIIASRHN